MNDEERITIGKKGKGDEMVGYEIYYQTKGIDSVDKYHIKCKSCRYGDLNRFNNYILCTKYNKLLVYGYIGEITQSLGYYFSTYDISSIILKYFDTNNNFDFNIKYARKFKSIRSMFIDIDGVDLTSKKSNDKNIQPITFSLTLLSNPNPKRNNCTIRMGLIGFKNNLSNCRLKKYYSNIAQWRKKERLSNKYLTRRDFFEEFKSSPPSFLTLDDRDMHEKGFTKNEDGYAFARHVMEWDNICDSTMIPTVAIDIVNLTMKCYLNNNNNNKNNNNINSNNNMEAKITTAQLKNNMIYIFTLDIRGCICQNETDKGCLFRLKVQQA